MPEAPEPWYANGLAFACTRCGHCCTGEPGTVLVEEHELARLRERLALSDEAFRGLYTRTLPSGRVVLRETAAGDCIFWKAERGCTVYEDRPRQCRTWPFWHANVESPEAWRAAARGCPGMDRGERHDAATIRATSARDGTLSAASRRERETPPRAER